MGSGPVRALLEIIAAIILWSASMVLAQFGVEADFTRPTAHAAPVEQSPPPTAGEPRETPAAGPGPEVRRTGIHAV
jgi:hypothetical protein